MSTHSLKPAFSKITFNLSFGNVNITRQQLNSYKAFWEQTISLINRLPTITLKLAPHSYRSYSQARTRNFHHVNLQLHD